MKKGFTLLEILIALGVITIIGVGAFAQVFYGQRANFFSGDMTRATFLAQEAMGIIENIRDDKFAAIDSSKHGLAQVNGIWQLVDDPEIIDNYFKREVVITNVDNYRKDASVKISWPATSLLAGPSPNAINLDTRFTNWQPTIEDWSEPQLDGAFDLTPSNSGANNHNVLTLTVLNNYLYIGNAQSNGKEFMIFDITQSPNIAVSGSLDLPGNPNRIAVLGNYAYIGSTHNNGEIKVIDISNKNWPTLKVNFNLTVDNSGADNQQILAMGVAGNILVAGREISAGEELLLFDITNPTAPLLQGKMHLSADPKDLKISGANVFVATTDPNEELQVINIADPLFPTKIGGLNLPGGALANAIDLMSGRAYVGRDGDNNDKELAMLDIQNPLNSLLLSEFDVGDNSAHIRHVSFASADDLVFLLTADNNADFRVVQISGIAMSPLSTFDLAGTPNQADYSPLIKRMIVGGQSDPEIQILAPKIKFQ